MRNGISILLLLVFVSVAAAQEPEPTYRGKSVRQWLLEGCPEYACPEVCRHSVIAAMDMEAVPTIVDLIRDPETPEWRLHNLYWFLGQIPGAPLDVVCEGLRDTASTARRSAAAHGVGENAEGQAGRVLPLLIEALGADRYDVRSSAVFAIGRLGKAAASAAPKLIALLGRYDYIAEQAERALAEIGLSAVPSLIEALSSGKEHARVRAARALGEIGSPARPALARLRHALKNDTLPVRRVAAVALGRLGSDAAIPDLVQCLKPDDPTFLSDYALTGLVHLGESAAHRSEEIGAMLLHGNGYERSRALQALQGMGPAASPALPAILETVAKPDHDETCAAIRTLGFVGNAAAMPALLRAARREDSPWQQEAAADALGRLGSTNGQVLAVLRGLLAAEDQSVRLTAAAALTRLGVEPLGTLLAKVDVSQEPCGEIASLGDLGPWAASALPLLLDWLADSAWDDPRRLEVRGAIRGVGSSAIPQLLAALDARGRPKLRRAAAIGLRELRATAAASEALARALGDPDPKVRRAAADTLEVYGPIAVSSLPALDVASRDPVDEVRYAAKRAARLIRLAAR